MIYDRTLGNLLHKLFTVAYVYYALWIVVTPFVDPDHPTQRFFPPREYGLSIVAVTFALILVVSLSAVSVVLLTGGGGGVGVGAVVVGGPSIAASSTLSTASRGSSRRSSGAPSSLGSTARSM